jgi:hypothetical protein
MSTKSHLQVIIICLEIIGIVGISLGIFLHQMTIEEKGTIFSFGFLSGLLFADVINLLRNFIRSKQRDPTECLRHRQ